MSRTTEFTSAEIEMLLSALGIIDQRLKMLKPQMRGPGLTALNNRREECKVLKTKILALAKEAATDESSITGE